MTTTTQRTSDKNKIASPIDLYMVTADGVVKGQVVPGEDRMRVLQRDLAGEIVRDVHVDPFNPAHLYAVTTTDVFSSDDDGATWQYRRASGLRNRWIWTMAIHPTRPNEIYVGTSPAALYVSTDGGETFRDLVGIRQLPDFDNWTFGGTGPRIRRIVLDARLPDEILIGIEEGGVAGSKDRGETWQDMSGPAAATYVWEVGPGGMGTPTAQDGPPIIDGRVYRDVHDVVRDPNDLNRVFASTQAGIYITEDSGKTWDRRDYNLSDAVGYGLRGYSVPLSLHPDRPERLFLGYAHEGPGNWFGHRTAQTGPFNISKFSNREPKGAGAVVLRSDDQGKTWRELHGGLPEKNPYMIWSVVTHPDDADVVFAAYTDGSVYRTDDGGDNWQQIASGIEKLFGIRIKGGR